MKLPRGVVAQSPQPAERMELRNVSLRSAAVAMSLIRAVIGFLFFELLFWLRENHYNNVWIGAVIGASTAGLMLGNGLASPLRSRLREELMLTAAIVLVAVSGLGAAMFGGVGAAIVLAAVANLASGIGRMAFDSIVQRDAPDANQGRGIRQVRDALPTVVGVGRGDPGAAHVPGPGCVPDRRACRRVGRLPVHAVGPGCAREAGATGASCLLADQFEAGDPQPRSVDLGRGRQGLRAGEKRAEPGLADSIDDAGR